MLREELDGRSLDNNGDHTTRRSSTSTSSLGAPTGPTGAPQPIDLTGSSRRIPPRDIAGIVFAGVALLALLSGVAFYLRRKWRKKSRDKVDLLSGSSSAMSEMSSRGGPPFISGLLRVHPVNGDKKVEEASTNCTIGHSQKSDISNISSSDPGAENSEHTPPPTSPEFSLGRLSSTSHGDDCQGTPKRVDHPLSLSEDTTLSPRLTNSDPKVPNVGVLNNTRDLRRELENRSESRYFAMDEFANLVPHGTATRSENGSLDSILPPYPN